MGRAIQQGETPMTGSMFCFCPHCGSDLRDRTTRDGKGIPCHHDCGADDHGTRLIGCWDALGNRTVGFQCPDCGKRWER